jgi:hypothetical protein
MIPNNFIYVYGLNLERRIWDQILYELDSSDNYYSQFHHPSCELIQ